MASDTIEKVDLVDAVIKVKDNYSSFIPTTTGLIDEDGNRFLIQIVTHSEGRWLKERNPRIHGSFTRKAAENFYEFNLKVEQFVFDGCAVVITEKIMPESPTAGKTDMKIHRSEGSIKNNKRISRTNSNSNLNYDGDNDNSGKMVTESVLILKLTEKRKGKKVCREVSPPNHFTFNAKRKVTFSSPRMLIFLLMPIVPLLSL